MEGECRHAVESVEKRPRVGLLSGFTRAATPATGRLGASMLLRNTPAALQFGLHHVRI